MKKEEKPKAVSIGGNFNFGQGQAIGNVEGDNQPLGGTRTHHSQFSSFTTAAYNNDVPPPYPPPAYPYGYPPPYHHPLGLGPQMPQPMYAYVPAWKQEQAVEAAAGVAAQKPPPKTEAEPKPVAAAADPPPTAATATYQQPPRKEPPAADGYPCWDVAGYPPPPYGYPPRHGGYHDGGGYPVQGYPTHQGHGHGGGYGYYRYGATQHMGMGRLAAGAAAVHEAYHRYRQWRSYMVCRCRVCTGIPCNSGK